MNKNWKAYLVDFELTVLLPVYMDNSSLKAEPVPLRIGKLHKTSFFDFIGSSFESNQILSFNYYGLFKPSTALQRIKPLQGRSTVNAPVIHFSSIKMDHIEKYNKKLLLEFVSFKKFLVALRWT